MTAGDPNSRLSPCRGCGKPIMWGVTEEGKKIPLDPKPPVYRVVHDRSQDGKWTIRAIRKENCMVSHFATCPAANQFSASRKAGATPA